MIDKKQTVAVIIPAYNEAQHIGACIESLLNQTLPVNEVIVVCNNCTDDTANISNKYPGVKVIETDTKGLINARNIGFNSAHSDILARLNADVVCSRNWNEVLAATFRGQGISAVSGVAKTMTLPLWPHIYTAFWSKIYIYWAEAYFGVSILWGANMAISKNAWLDIRDVACTNDSEIHEDQDLSIHLAEKSRKIKFQKNLVVATNEKSYFEWDKFHKYNLIRKNTKATHKYLVSRSAVNSISHFGRAWRIIVIFVPGVAFYSVSAFNKIISKLMLR